ALAADHPRRGARLPVHADQPDRLRQPRSAHRPAGVGLDQPVAPARRLVRHRRARDLSRQSNGDAPQRARLQYLLDEPGVRRAAACRGGSADRARLSGDGRADGVDESARSRRDAAGDDAQLQRRLDDDSHQLRPRRAGHSDLEKAERARFGGGGALMAAGDQRSDRRVFLSAVWRQLAMLNYRVDPALLAPYLPAGTTLDLWRGDAFISVVGLLFDDTRVLHVPIPFHITFPEVNLRCYVRREVGGETRRGVVFIRELVPRAAIAFVARAA